MDVTVGFADPPRGRWLSAPLFLALAWWQVRRAEAGNILSYGYAVEWPLFVVAAVYLWWYLLHMEPRRGRSHWIEGRRRARGQ